MKHPHLTLFFAISTGMLLAVGCGGGGSSSNNGHTIGGGGTGAPTPTPSTTSTPATGSNTMSVTVNGGPVSGQIYADGLFATVTVCVPGTSTCQNISNVLVDTGSSGLRIFNNQLTIALPKNATLGNCIQYVDTSYNWGIVATADIQLGSELASSVPIQLIGDPSESGDSTFPNIPSGCSTSNTGIREDDVASLGTNGILGVGPFLQDCGTGCAPGTSSNPGLYYSCPTVSTCSVTTVNVNNQVQNPVSLFATDNNGVIVELPAVGSSGQASATGSLVFGIGTQSNNGLGSASIYALDPNTLGFTTTYNGTTYGTGSQMGSFVDSGSNGLFFLDGTTIGNGFNACPSPSESGFYCSSSSNAFTYNVQNNSISGLKAASFTVVDANTLFNANGGINAAFDNLAGPNTGQFDYGLSFFFGKNIYTAFEQHTVATHSGPFWAF